MATLNKVFLIGNLTKDPEVRRTPSGTSVADLRMAVNRRFKTADGESRDETCFVNVTAWSRQAETCGEYLSKGSPIMVEGRLKFDEWEKEGQKQSRLSVVAERIQFLSGGQRHRAEKEDAPSMSEGPPPSGSSESPGPESGGDDDNLPF